MCQKLLAFVVVTTLVVWSFGFEAPAWSSILWVSLYSCSHFVLSHFLFCFGSTVPYLRSCCLRLSPPASGSAATQLISFCHKLPQLLFVLLLHVVSSVHELVRSSVNWLLYSAVSLICCIHLLYVNFLKIYPPDWRHITGFGTENYRKITWWRQTSPPARGQDTYISLSFYRFHATHTRITSLCVRIFTTMLQKPYKGIFAVQREQSSLFLSSCLSWAVSVIVLLKALASGGQADHFSSLSSSTTPQFAILVAIWNFNFMLNILLLFFLSTKHSACPTINFLLLKTLKILLHQFFCLFVYSALSQLTLWQLASCSGPASAGGSFQVFPVHCCYMHDQYKWFVFFLPIGGI